MPLFEKDLRQYAVELLLLVLFELASIFSLILQLPQRDPALILSLAFGISLVGGFVFSFRTVATEESSRSMAFLLALPLTAPQIVSHKFLVNFLLTSLNFILVFGLVLLYCVWQTSFNFTLGSTLLTLWLLQLLNNHLFLSCSLLFSSTKAIWLPFPLLLIGMNVAVNWHRVAQLLPTITVPAMVHSVLLSMLVLSLFLITKAMYGRRIASREWS